MKKLVPVVCLLALGCGDDDRPADSGTIVLMDTGARDAGGGGVDAGGGGMDAGGGGCAPVTLPAPMPTTPPCTMAQIDDLTSRATAEEQQAWFEDPANAECGSCINSDVLSCATMNGCDDEAGQVSCCLETACGASATEAEFEMCARMAQSAGGACGDESNTFIMCVNGTLSSRTCGISPVCVMTM